MDWLIDMLILLWESPLFCEILLLKLFIELILWDVFEIYFKSFFINILDLKLIY